MSASPDATFQLAPLLLWKQPQDKPAAGCIAEQYVKVNECLSNPSQISAGDATARNCVQDRQDTRIQEPSDLFFRKEFQKGRNRQARPAKR